MKRTLFVCAILAALCCLVIALAKDAPPPMPSTTNSAAVVEKPLMERLDAAVTAPADAYAAAKIRYWELVDRLLSGTATGAQQIELRDLCQEFDLEYPEMAPFEEPSGADRGSLDNGGPDTLNNCASATVIPGCPYVDTGNLDGDNDCSVISASPYDEVFYTFTPTVSGLYQFRVKIDSTTAPAIRIVSGACCSGAVAVGFGSGSVATDCPRPDSAGNEPTTRVTYARAALTAGVQYWIHVGISSTTLITFRGYTFWMTCVPCPQPEWTSHQTCTTAQPVAIGDSVLGNGTLANPDWYSFTVPGPNNDSVRIFVGNREWGHCLTGLYPNYSTYATDGRFTLFRGCGGAVDSISYDDDGGCSLDARKDFCLAPGTYYVRVWNYARSATPPPPVDSSYVFKTIDLGICGVSVGRCCYGDPCNPTCADRTQSACTALGGTWTAGLNCTANPCPVPPAGGLCCNAIQIMDAGSWVNTTCGMLDNYNTTCLGYYDGGEDILYAWTVTTPGDYRLDLTTNATYVGIAVDRTCPMSTGTCYAMATSSGANASIACTYFAAGTYFIMIDTWPSPTCIPQFTLTITWCPPCIVECPTGGVVDLEPVCYDGYVDNFNGGCNWIPYVFEPIQCGETICGKLGTYVFTDTIAHNYRDMDWFEFTTTERESLRVTARGEFNIRTWIIKAPCPGTSIVSNAVPACSTFTIAACVDPGTYYIVVAPNVFVGVPCDKDYWLTLDCLPCWRPPHCECETLPNSFCNLVGGPILDVSTVSFPINVGASAIIGDVNVCLNLTHTFDGDMVIYLQSPAGVVDTLIQRRGSGGDNMLCTVLDDEAATPISAGVAPFTGSFIPDFPLSAFDGQNAMGVWTLFISDRVGGDVGRLFEACLTFTFFECPADSIVMVPNNPAFPDSQDVWACLHLNSGAVPAVVCVPVRSQLNVPHLTITLGCNDPVHCYEPTCPPALGFRVDPWVYYPGHPPYYCVRVWKMPEAPEGCCVCVHLDFILPVELTSFTAVAGDGQITLNWATASETNMDHFEIVRGEAVVARPRATNSIIGDSYSWTDHGVVNGTTYTYTLRSVEASGNVSDLATVSAVPLFGLAEVTEYALSQNYPNPFNPVTSITFDLVEDGFVSLKVYNLMGQAMATVVNGSVSKGRHMVNFDAGDLPSGVYVYRLEVNGFVAAKKMLLMK